jgi:hypothetical protein
MTIQNKQNKKSNDTGKLNTLATVLRLGHEAFRKNTLSSVFTHILNNSKLVLNYDRTCIADISTGVPKIVEISGQPSVNTNSEYSVNMQIVLKAYSNIEEITIINKNSLIKNKAKSSVLKAFDYLSNLSHSIILVPLRPPETNESKDEMFIWALEYSDELLLKNEISLITLLSNHYSEAVWYKIKRTESKFNKIIRKRKIFTVRNVFICCFQKSSAIV